MNYWNCGEYWGFGAAAHGFAGNRRYYNSNEILNYKKNYETITPEIALEEAIILGLRKVEGIDIEKIKSKFGIDFEKKFAGVLKKFKDYFVKTDKGFALTTEGFLISNEILCEFV